MVKLGQFFPPLTLFERKPLTWNLQSVENVVEDVGDMGNAKFCCFSIYWAKLTREEKKEKKKREKKNERISFRLPLSSLLFARFAFHTV
jgi:hypothetical protein